MAEVTAEMIERRRDDDSRSAVERRRTSQRVRDARLKLAATASGHRFDGELLRLYAERRAAALPAVMCAAAALAAVAWRWTPAPLLGGWLVASVVAMLASYQLARSFLRGAPDAAHLHVWRRAFVVSEIAQGAVWATMILIASDRHDPQIATFALVAMLLVAAMNATVTATIPAAVYGALAPMTATVTLAFRPLNVTDGRLLFVMLSLGTLLFFVYLARKLRETSLQALAFRAEKDELIAELEQSTANSELARSRAEESNLAKSRFLATMSHELRTPLNAILGFSEIMKSELFGIHAIEAYRGYSQDIHASGEHLLMLINEILDLSRVEAGRYDLHEEAVDFLEVVEDCRHLMMLRATKKDIALTLDPVGYLPRLWADKRALRQIVLNLVSNAVKFTPPGGRVTIRLDATPDGGQRLAISDTGAGIPEAEIPVVMAAFGRGSLAHKGAEEGTGLGLPIVKGLVELHGGTFALESKLRAGTRAVVCLPPARVISALEPLPFAEEDPVFPPTRPPLRSAA